MKKEFNKYYLVKEDETIESIATKLNKNPLEILLSNRITPNMIKKGLVLYIKNI